MKVVADKELCVGAGQCAMVAERVFTQDDSDGTVVVLKEVPDAGEEADARQAVLICPSGALSLDES
ncbi:ferredoxin [Actinokineospora bangkokensis]|uniref:Ferredoxin n=1 Tax=Actinokineospora bangkokensis TaxID=1193682 RepID=A0A1Q9LNY2_9PSEU|nr:ferredoxin [Actinokineospora bangkokensis]OLR93713.1 ferredoxin [Actinokineospora bangkokensis]